MTARLDERERAVERSRARLEATLDGLRARLGPAGLAEEALDALHRAGHGAVIDDALAAFRRNPVPVALAVGALIWFANDVQRQARARRETAPASRKE